MGTNSRIVEERLWGTPLLPEKYQSGCAWGLMNVSKVFLEHPHRKLLAGSRHSTDGNDSAGVHARDKPSLPVSDKKSQCSHEVVQNRTPVIRSRNERTSKMPEKERVITKPVKNESGEEKQVQRHPETLTSSKSYVKTHHRHRQIHDVKTRDQKASHSVSVDKHSKLTYGGIFCSQMHPKRGPGFGCKSTSVANDKEYKKTSVQSLEMNKAAEALVNEKLVHGGHHSDDWRGYKSEQFLEALQILNSNKQLFLKLLEDPNSLLVKHIQDLRNSQAKEQKHESAPHRDGLQQRSGGFLSWERIKSWRKLYPRRSNEKQHLYKIVVLEPRGESMQHTEKTCDSVESQSCTINEVHTVRQSHFPFQSWRRKSKHSSKQNIEFKGGISSSFLDLEKREKGGKNNGLHATVGRKSASTDEENCENLKFMIDTEHEERKLYSSVARISHSKPPSKQDLDKAFLNEQFIRTRSRSVSLPEQGMLSFPSSGKSGEVGFLTAQMRLCPYSCHKPNCWDRCTTHREKENNYLTPQRPNKEVQTLGGCACGKATDLYNYPEANLDTDEKLTGTQTHEDVASTINSVSQETTNDMLPSEVDCSVEGSALSYGPYCCTDRSTSTTDEDRERGRFCCFELDSPGESEMTSSSFSNSSSIAVDVGKSENPITLGTEEELSYPESLEKHDINVFVSSGIPVTEPADLPPGSPKPALHNSNSDFPSNTAANKLGCRSNCIASVLIAAALNWDELLRNYHEPDCLLSPSLFGDQAETQPDDIGIDHRLLFDHIDEVLQGTVHKRYFTLLGLKTTSVQPDEDVAHEVMKSLDWNLILQKDSHTLEQIVEKDIVKPRVWVEIEKDAEGIAIEMAESILEDIIDEMELVELQH